MPGLNSRRLLAAAFLFFLAESSGQAASFSIIDGRQSLCSIDFEAPGDAYVSVFAQKDYQGPYPWVGLLVDIPSVDWADDARFSGNFDLSFYLRGDVRVWYSAEIDEYYGAPYTIIDMEMLETLSKHSNWTVRLADHISIEMADTLSADQLKQFSRCVGLID